MPELVYIPTTYPILPGLTALDGVAAHDLSSLPTVGELRRTKRILTVGMLGDQDSAAQLAGALKLVLEHGPKLICAYPLGPDAGMARLLQELAGLRAVEHGELELAFELVHPAFREFFTIYGRAHSAWDDNSDAEILASAKHKILGTMRPTALYVPRGRGGIYAIPYYFAGRESHFVPTLFQAIDEHETSAGTEIPSFLSGLRLPGEAELLTSIENREVELERLRGDASALARWRHLLGTAGTGEALERLVIDTLNLILANTGFRAEDREDLYAEDFWIVGPDGDVALAEVKGTNTNIRRDDVNQVDGHRERLDHTPALPGLLIVNVFRKQANLEARQQPIHDDVVRRAANSNVLIMRTWDVFNLVHQTLAKRVSGDRLINLLIQGGGGWLEVDEQSIALKRGDVA